MNVAGLQKCSFVDFPGKLSAVVFTSGCNLNCFYCHNRQLVREDATDTGHRAALAWLADRRGLLDGVVVSGGEPTLQRGLDDFLQGARVLGFATKLDTNGTRPNVLRGLIEAGLVDYVAMDVKAPLQDYELMTGRGDLMEAVAESIDLLLEGRVDYEFRTTLAPPLETSDVVAIAQRIKGARRYVLQQYRRPVDAAPFTQPQPHADAYVFAAHNAVRGIVDQCEIRGLNLADPDRTVQTGHVTVLQGTAGIQAA